MARAGARGVGVAVHDAEGVVAAHGTRGPGPGAGRRQHREERREERLVPVPPRHHHLRDGPPARRRGPAVRVEVLRGGHRLQVRRVVALQPRDVRPRQPRRQERALAVRLLRAAPARVARDVDLRREAGQRRGRPREPRGRPRRLEAVAQAPGLAAYRGADVAQQLRVERGRQGDALGEHGDVIVLDAVQALPRGVGLEAQAGDVPRHVQRRVVGCLQLRHLLCEREARHQRRHPLREGGGRVAPRLVGLGAVPVPQRGCGGGHQQHKQEPHEMRGH